jgi:hypothetical protein
MKTRALTLTALVLAAAVNLIQTATAQTTVRDGDENIYGANIGWINARADNESAYGLKVSEHVCSGYLYSANVGWIHMGDGTPNNGIAYDNSSATDYGVNNVGDGRLNGYAYGANIGWIKFDKDLASNPPRYDLVSGKLRGYAYGANIGWINLGETDPTNVDATLASVAAAPDTDGDGIADFWELSESGLAAPAGLAVYAGGGADKDGDGQSDVNEYLAGTDPDIKDSILKIISYVPIGGYASVDLTFTSNARRLYRAQTRTDLVTGSWANLGNLELGGASQTTFNVPVTNGEGTRYWKIMSIRPLVQ